MKKIFLPIILFAAIITIFASCEKQTPPRVVITVIDSEGKLVMGAKVNINGNATAGCVIDVTQNTGTKGTVSYSQPFDAVLEAIVTVGSKSGKEYFQLKQNEITEKTIVVK